MLKWGLGTGITGTSENVMFNVFVSQFCCLSGDCRMSDASSNLKGMLRFLPPPLKMHDWKKMDGCQAWIDAKQLLACRQKT